MRDNSIFNDKSQMAVGNDEKQFVSDIRNIVISCRDRAYAAIPQKLPTVWGKLCAETNPDIARYSVLHDSDQLFAAKYITCLPTEEELRREIECQKAIFLMQTGDK